MAHLVPVRNIYLEYALENINHSLSERLRMHRILLVLVLFLGEIPLSKKRV